MTFDVQFKEDKTFKVGFGEIQEVGGADGKSAYEIALDNGFEGTEEEWLESLKGKDGHAPVKGADYFTPEDIEGLNIPVVDKELNADSDNAIANKVVAEFKQDFDNQSETYGQQFDDHEERIKRNANDISTLADSINSPKEVIEFTNGVKLEAYSGYTLMICYTAPTGEEDVVTLFDAGAVKAAESEWSWLAECDVNGNEITETYATKEEVDTKIQTYVDEAILGGAW